jgi:isopentenyldiphosphate isomerase
MGSPADELVEVLAEDGSVERVVTRAEMRANNLRHRNIAVFVERPDGRLVVHQRADWKDVYPSLWDVAFGGVPGVGEPDDVAAVRELAEEAGLTVDPADLRYLGAQSRDTDAVRWVGSFYAITTEAVLHPADGEVQAMEEVDVADVRRWAAIHPLCPDVEPLLDVLDVWLG